MLPFLTLVPESPLSLPWSPRPRPVPPVRNRDGDGGEGDFQGLLGPWILPFSLPCAPLEDDVTGLQDSSRPGDVEDSFPIVYYDTYGAGES